MFLLLLPPSLAPSATHIVLYTYFSAFPRDVVEKCRVRTLFALHAPSLPFAPIQLMFPSFRSKRFPLLVLPPSPHSFLLFFINYILRPFLSFPPSLSLLLFLSLSLCDVCAHVLYFCVYECESCTFVTVCFCLPLRLCM